MLLYFFNGENKHNKYYNDTVYYYHRSGGTGFPDTDGLEGPFIPVTDVPGGPMVGGGISSMTGQTNLITSFSGFQIKNPGGGFLFYFLMKMGVATFASATRG
jgi:hypothetical protein